MLVPARLPHVLDIAHYGCIADVHRTGEAAPDLLAVAIVTMPIELESHRELEVEHTNVLHRRTAVVQLHWVRCSAQRCPAGCWHCCFAFTARPVKGQHRGR